MISYCSSCKTNSLRLSEKSRIGESLYHCTNCGECINYKAEFSDGHYYTEKSIAKLRMNKFTGHYEIYSEESEYDSVQKIVLFVLLIITFIIAYFISK